MTKALKLAVVLLLAAFSANASDDAQPTNFLHCTNCGFTGLPDDTSPSGYAHITNWGGATPTGPAGGDLTGTYPNPTIKSGVLSPAPNVLINPAMEIDQVNEGASVSVPTDSATHYIVDGWAALAGSAASALTAQRSADAPPGFQNSLLFTVGTASATVGASDFIEIRQKIEANNLTASAFGTASAQKVVACFWAKSSVAATFTQTLANVPATRSYPTANTLSATNTWQKFCNVIAGDTAGSWTLSGTSGSVQLRFALESGSALQGVVNTWNAGNFDGTSTQTQLSTTNGATFQLAGIKLEISPAATTFARDPSVEFLRARRYYEKSYDLGTAISTNTFNGATVYIASTTLADVPIMYKVPCASTPTITVYSGSSGVAAKFLDFTASADVAASIFNIGLNGTHASVTSVATHEYIFHWTKDCRL